MTPGPRDLRQLLPGATDALLTLLDPARGPLERPIRSEIFGPERFAQHGRSLAATHAARYAPRGSATFFPRLQDNIEVLREAHDYIARHAGAGHEVSPAAEWLLDNFHVVQAQLREIRDGLPRRYFRDLPVLTGEPLVGLPRIYGVAWAFVAHTDSAFNEELLLRFLLAYEERRELTLGELWALPTTLRVVLIEDLRRLAERAATHKAARAAANLFADNTVGPTADHPADHPADPTADHPADSTLDRLDALLALLNRRAVGEPFLAQLAQRVQGEGGAAVEPLRAWLAQNAPHLAELQQRVPADQAADNLSVANAITSLRAIGDADWPDVVGRTSALTQTMLASAGFAAEREDTRDATLHEIEALARRSGRSERDVAEAVLAQMRTAAAATAADATDARPGAAWYWLHGAGRPSLLAALGLAESRLHRLRTGLRRHALPLYLGAIGAATAFTVWWLCRHAGPVEPPLALGIAVALLVALPASEAVVALVNRLISESLRPIRLPRLALPDGIPPEHRTLVVIPAMLTRPTSGDELAHQLRLHFIANPECEVQFAMLTDWPDAPEAHRPADDAMLQAAVRAIEGLNVLHPAEPDRPPRFLVLHRPRVHAASEGCWMGWERKRGKLEQLLALLARGGDSPFLDLGEASRLAPAIRHVLTLDSDTRLPPGRLHELVGIAAHPANAPRIDAATRRVTHGYAILQPHVATPLPAPEDVTLFHALFAGAAGIDPYSVASSEVYQDLFGEGTFTGKGLLHVQAVDAVLAHRLPEAQVLSHDLIEGSLARCAAATDVDVIEDAPFHADVAASRVHRWTRGDWQLLPLLLAPSRYPVAAVNRWKMIDNLRRSLVAPASLVLLVASLLGDAIAPWAALALVALAFTAGPLIGGIAGLAPGRDDVARGHFYRQALRDLGRAVAIGAFQLALLLQMALLSLDAIGRALWRTLVSRRHLLQWTTAQAAQALAGIGLAGLLKRHAVTSLVAVGLGALLAWHGSTAPWLAALLVAAWAMTPVWVWWVSRPRPMRRADALSADDRTHLAGVARDTWRLFERVVSADEHHLPPDNLQVAPHDLLAHRTSPTNIGLYLLSTACARAFGWIGRAEMMARLEATLASLQTLERHRGHFLNWYDTARAATLLPRYVSTVDSGNLCLHLIAVAQACDALVSEPEAERAATRARGITGARERIAAMQAASAAPWAAGGAVAALLNGADGALAHATSAAALDAATLELDAIEPALVAAAGETETLPSTHALRVVWAARDLITTLRSAARDLHRSADEPESADTARLYAIAATCRRLAQEPEFGFLFHAKRRLFHIGYRVDDGQLDRSFYDLLASEARGTGLWAIAKGDVSARHWAALGRPFFAVGHLAALRSWSGSMFEYLMPTLVLDEPDGSVLHSAALAAVREHMAHGRAHGVPWGVSESAYAGSDHTLAYQYAPQGVPSLALRRTPLDELVVAPYATGLAAQVVPHPAVANLRRYETLRARGRFGYMESLDYTPARQIEAQTEADAAGAPYTRVQTFMAHHQGMTLVALANVLLDRVPRRWGSSDPRIEAVASLLHERAPREVPGRGALPSTPASLSAGSRSGSLVQDVQPGTLAIEPTQLVANGRYAVALRANGAGVSRWGAFGLNRSRDDPLRDAFGHFFWLRRTPDAPLRSLTQHPAPDRDARYHAQFQPDRAVFGATWSDVDTEVTVWVSPEDDIEFRHVVLHNRTDKPLPLELISAFEPTLADPRADEAHPAFSNLFIVAEWHAAHEAMVLERKPRLATDRRVVAAHFLVRAGRGTPARSEQAPPRLALQADRARWQGRNRLPGRPLGELVPAPEPASGHEAEPIRLETGLDPMSAIGAAVTLAPRGRVEFTLCVAAAAERGTLLAVVDKYRQGAHVERASMMSATLGGIRLREMDVGADSWLAVRTLTTLLAQSLVRVHAKRAEPHEACDRRLLWRFGISGDRPIVFVNAGVEAGLGVLRVLAQALRHWAWGGIACDLVVVNHEPVSYLQAMARSAGALREAHAAAMNAQPGTADTGFFVIPASDLHDDERSTLRALARLRLNADGRPLAQHVADVVEQHEMALATRAAAPRVALSGRMGAGADTGRSGGEFAGVGGEFRFDVSRTKRPPRPWVNVIANPSFGTQLSEGGGGYTFATNSRLNMLTPWSNDPVADPPGEHLLLQDVRSARVWSALPSAGGDDAADYRVVHGQGYSVVSHRHESVEVQATWCVDPELAVKQVRVRLVNRGHRTVQWRIVGLVEWICGQNRADRSTTRIAHSHHRASLAENTTADRPGAAPQRMTALHCTQRDRSGGFGGGTAFYALAGDPEDLGDWTGDRREAFDADGRLVLPAQWGRVEGGGLDPCAALAARVTLRAGDTVDRVFVLGWAPSPEAALALADRVATERSALQRLQAVRQHWDDLLGATTVRTPDPLFDALVNRWLPYQAMACRLWAKAGFYQAGGAYGYRDQLQDALSLAWSRPAMLRAQIVLAASRQFPEGDVQHWWHAPTGAGVRTHFSDDLLWLPYAVAHYLETTGDRSVLDEPVPFLEGMAVPEGAEDAYYAPGISPESASVHEHAARTLDRATAHDRSGAHGLPLMGTGDWNDGMNRVGHEGRGESVWLAWFALDIVAKYAPIAEARGEHERAARWRAAADGWRTAIERDAWDGAWYRRAFFDDGSPLGTAADAECRIDAIAQAWAVLSNAAEPQRARRAMRALDAELVEREANLVRLLTPPLQHHEPSAGYIQAYPPGVRENGGQYTHAGVWALMAHAQLGNADAAWRTFTALSPAHRSRHPAFGDVYAIEPYVIAGDTYGAAPYLGRGGWSWYTGAAGWLARAAVESLLGFRWRAGRELTLTPCLPPHWADAELTLTRGEVRLRLVLVRGADAAAARAAALGADLLQPGDALDWTTLRPQSVRVVPIAAP